MYIVQKTNRIFKRLKLYQIVARKSEFKFGRSLACVADGNQVSNIVLILRESISCPNFKNNCKDDNCLVGRYGRMDWCGYVNYSNLCDERHGFVAAKIAALLEFALS